MAFVTEKPIEPIGLGDKLLEGKEVAQKAQKRTLTATKLMEVKVVQLNSNARVQGVEIAELAKSIVGEEHKKIREACDATIKTRGENIATMKIARDMHGNAEIYTIQMTMSV